MKQCNRLVALVLMLSLLLSYAPFPAMAAQPGEPQFTGQSQTTGQTGETPTSSDQKQTVAPVKTWSWVIAEGRLNKEGKLEVEGPLDMEALQKLLPEAILQDTGKPVPVLQWLCPEYLADGEGNWPATGEFKFIPELKESVVFDATALPRELFVVVTEPEVPEDPTEDADPVTPEEIPDESTDATTVETTSEPTTSETTVETTSEPTTETTTGETTSETTVETTEEAQTVYEAWAWVDPSLYLAGGSSLSLDPPADLNQILGMMPKAILLQDGRVVPITQWNSTYAQDEEGNWPAYGSFYFTPVYETEILFAEGIMPRTVTVTILGEIPVEKTEVAQDLSLSQGSSGQTGDAAGNNIPQAVDDPTVDNTAQTTSETTVETTVETTSETTSETTTETTTETTSETTTETTSETTSETTTETTTETTSETTGELVEIQTQVVTQTVDISELLPDEDLREGYLQLQSQDGTGWLPHIQTFSIIAPEDQLAKEDKALYNLMKNRIRAVAAGTESLAIVTGPLESYSTEELGVNKDVGIWGNGSSLTPPADAMLDLLHDVGLMVDVILRELPYECYWLDKTAGVTWTMSYGGVKCVGDRSKDRLDIQFTIYMCVENKYAKEGGQFFKGKCVEADPDKTGSKSSTGPAAADKKAREIVLAHAAEPDLQKLRSYRDEICALTDYDFDALNDRTGASSDTWQMIHVFDGDPNTKAVCEGYSKAFQYLCDLSIFRGDVQCFQELGMCGGPHMWNVVSIDGVDLLADVTNSDSGMIGQSGSLFLQPVTAKKPGTYHAGGVTYSDAGYELSQRSDMLAEIDLPLKTPKAGEQPVTKINGEGYYAEITWSPKVSGTFLPDTDYTATITLTPTKAPFSDSLQVSIYGRDSLTVSETGTGLRVAGKHTFPSTASGLVALKAEDFTVTDNIVTYDGETHTPKVTSALTGIGEITVNTSGSRVSHSSETISIHVEKSSKYAAADLELPVKFTIKPRLVDLLVTVYDKDYDGNKNADVTAMLDARNILIPDRDNVSLKKGTAVFKSEGPGKSIPVILTGYEITGADAENYTLVIHTYTGEIRGSTKPVVTMQKKPSAKSRPYDGTAQPLITTGLVALKSAEIQYRLDGETEWADTVPTAKFVGDYRVWYRVLVRADAAVSGIGEQPIDVKISPKALTADVTVEDKPYDGTTQAVITGAKLQGVCGSDEVQLTTGTAQFANSDVEADKTVILDGFAITGKDAGNYTLTAPTATASIQAAVKKYPQLNAPPLGRNLIYSGGEQELATSGQATNGTIMFELEGKTPGAAIPKAKKPGTYKIRYWVVGDEGYESLEPVLIEAKIEAKPLTASITVKTREEDGTKDAVIEKAVLDPGKIDGDTVTLHVGTAAFVDPGPGTDIPVNLTDFYLEGAHADNYKLILPAVTGTITGKVAPAVLKTAPAAISDLLYTSEPQALIKAGTAEHGTLQYQLDGGTWDTELPKAEKAGTYKVGYRVKGDTGYSDLPAKEFTVTIGKRTLTAQVVIEDKLFDNSLKATIKSSQLITSGVIAGDAVSMTQGTAEFTSKGPGTDIPVVCKGFTLTGADAGNYELTQPTGKASITNGKASLIAEPASQILTYNGKDQTLVSPGQASGGQVVYSTAKDGTYSSDLPTGRKAGTYEIWFKLQPSKNNTGTTEPKKVATTISRKNLTVGVSILDKFYDGTMKAQYRYLKLIGAAAGDDVYVSEGSPYFESPDVGTAITVKLPTYVLKGKDAGNYTLTQPDDTCADILAQPAKLTEKPQARDLTYDSEDQELVTAGEADHGTVVYRTDPFAPWSKEIPVGRHAGTYRVWYKVGGDDGWSDTVTQEIKVTIRPRALKAKVVLEDKFFDGTTAAKIKSVTLEGILEGDDVTVREGAAVFNSKQRGDDVAVTCSGFVLDGYHKHCYVLDQPFTVHADILKGNANLIMAPIPKKMVYNGKQQTLVAPGVVEGGKLLYSLKQEGPYSESIPTGLYAGTYQIWYKVDGGEDYYSLAPAMVDAVIRTAESANLEVTLSTTRYYADGSEKRPAVTVTVGGAILPDTEYTVTYHNNRNVGTAAVIVSDKAGGSYNLPSVTRYFVIQNAKDYSVPLIPSGNSSASTVKSSDQPALQQHWNDIQKTLEDPKVSKEDRKALEKQRDQQLKPLLDQLEEAQEAIDTSPIRKARTITGENLQLSDRKLLENAKSDLNDALYGKYQGNYSDSDIRNIQEQIRKIDRELASIDRVETISQEIRNLPKASDIDAGDSAVRRQLQSMTQFGSEHERQMLDDHDRNKLEAVKKAAANFRILDGNSQIWQRGGDGSLTLRCSGYFPVFEKLILDEGTPDERPLSLNDHYTAWAGSTCVELKQSCLDELPEGTHTLTFHYAEDQEKLGSAVAEFTVGAAGEILETTQNSSPMSILILAGWFLLGTIAAVSAVTITVLAVKRRKHK